MADKTIAENVVALIRRDKVYKTCTLTKGKKIRFDKLAFFPDNALGCFYGTQFEIHCQQLVPVGGNETDSGTEGTVVEGEECGMDNRDIVDDGSAQSLKECDIIRLRTQARGQDVVGTVVEHSTSFKVKTKYSQEKYIIKKTKKHAPVISILKPSTRTLCEMYYSRGPSKICHMRLDTVGQILTYSNVHAHSNMLIMETTQGLLLTAVLERMGGFGNLVQVFFGDFPVRLAIENSSHLSEEDKAPLLEYPLHRIGSKFPAVIRSSLLSSIHKSITTTPCVVPLTDCGSEATPGSSSDACAGDKCTLDENEGARMEWDSEEECGYHPAKRAKVVEDDNEGERRGEEIDQMQKQERKGPVEVLMGSISQIEPLKGNKEKREKRRQEREARYSAAEELLKQQKLDGLILACRFHPEPLLMTLLGFLAPSRPVVVYCHLLEPLVDCYKSLKTSEEVVFDVQISETWTRYYQVLPERTHPATSMDGHGGYLLTATTVKKL